MSFNFSKSKFVATWAHCNKYAWLDKNKPNEKTPPTEYAESLFDNGYKVGALAKKFFNVQVDVTINSENGIPDTQAMVAKTKDCIEKGVKVIAEASFDFNGLYCAVDILKRNHDDSYDIYEVKSSKIDPKKHQKYSGVKESYVIDASYQRYVLEKCGIKINKVNVVLLSRDYVRATVLELDKYFVICDVSDYTTDLQKQVEDKLKEVESVIKNAIEPKQDFIKSCSDCDYFKYCSKNVAFPSPFDVYDLNFDKKCDLYNKGVSFFDVPKQVEKIKNVSLKQIEYYNRPNDMFIDKQKIKEFLDSLEYPLYSLDFETYQAVVPDFEGVRAYDAIPFQYSLHVMKVANGNYDIGSSDIEEHHFLDVSGGDCRRAIAESLVKDIPYGACVIAYNTKGVEQKIIEKLASQFADLADHLLSYKYRDPKPLFQNGYCYNSKMWNSFSIKSVLPALYPNVADMDYHNLEGSIKNGQQAMTAIEKTKELSADEVEQIKEDLIKYCALDTFAIVKILKKFYEFI